MVTVNGCFLNYCIFEHVRCTSIWEHPNFGRPNLEKKRRKAANSRRLSWMSHAFGIWPIYISLNQHSFKGLKAIDERQYDGAHILHHVAQFHIDQVYLYTRCPCPSPPTQDPERQGTGCLLKFHPSRFMLVNVVFWSSYVLKCLFVCIEFSPKGKAVEP